MQRDNRKLDAHDSARHQPHAEQQFTNEIVLDGWRPHLKTCVVSDD